MYIHIFVCILETLGFGTWLCIDGVGLVFRLRLPDGREVGRINGDINSCMKRSALLHSSEPRAAPDCASRALGFCPPFGLTTGFCSASGLTTDARSGARTALSHPGVEFRAKLKSISEVAFVWELTKEIIHSILGFLQGGSDKNLPPRQPRETPQILCENFFI